MTHKLEVTAVFQAEGDLDELKGAETELTLMLKALEAVIRPQMELELVISVLEVKDGAENDPQLPQGE